MGLFDFLFNKENSDMSSYDEHCENCGELLEDCECDDQWISKQDTSQEFPFEELILIDEEFEDDEY